MDLQQLMDIINKAAMDARSDYHLTLGKLEKALYGVADTRLVLFDDGAGCGDMASYRGYYSDIAISDGKPETVLQWRKKVAAALKTTFEGYKGGDYPATSKTPLWRSAYGIASDVAIVGFDLRENAFVLLTKRIDDDAE